VLERTDVAWEDCASVASSALDISSVWWCQKAQQATHAPILPSQHTTHSNAKASRPCTTATTMADAKTREEVDDLWQLVPSFAATLCLCIAVISPEFWFTTLEALAADFREHIIRVTGGSVQPTREACKLALGNSQVGDESVVFLEHLHHPICGEQRNAYLNVRLSSKPAEEYCTPKEKKKVPLLGYLV